MLDRPSGSISVDRRLATALADLGSAPALLLAVSGGPDSMAMLALVHRWRSVLTAGPALHVATVDHGLRAESAAEADLVSREAARRGLTHATLDWVGAKPATGLQEKARRVRYRLLADHARAIGAPFIITAHHADDQAETVLMRLGRGSGVAGLAAMRRCTVLAPDITLVRPLLDWTKADLQAVCVAGDIDHVLDPSNENAAFHRVRLRRQRLAASAIGLDRAALLRLARRAARAEDALDAGMTRACGLLAIHRDAAGWHADLTPVSPEEPEILQRLLARALLDVTGAERVSLEKLEAMVDGLRVALLGRRSFRATLGGALLALERSGSLSITLEPSRRRGCRRPD